LLCVLQSDRAIRDPCGEHCRQREAENMSREIPRAFNPSGWDLVKTEMMRKERMLRETSGCVHKMLVDSHGTAGRANNTPAGWAWFTSAGFCDANDKERIVKTRFPQQPMWYDKPAAGHETIAETSRKLNGRLESEGRGSYLDRTDPLSLAQLSRQTMGTLRFSRTASEPRLDYSNAGPAAGVPTSSSQAGLTPTMTSRRQNARPYSDRCPKTPFGPAEPNLTGLSPIPDGKGLRTFNYTSTPNNSYVR
jgi:hypothetical protein